MSAAPNDIAEFFALDLHPRDLARTARPFLLHSYPTSRQLRPYGNHRSEMQPTKRPQKASNIERAHLYLRAQKCRTGGHYDRRQFFSSRCRQDTGYTAYHNSNVELLHSRLIVDASIALRSLRLAALPNSHPGNTSFRKSQHARWRVRECKNRTSTALEARLTRVLKPLLMV